MRTVTRSSPAIGSRIGLAFAALAMAAALAACGGSGLGLETAPAALDPNSPKLLANNVAFDAADLNVPANKVFVLVFENAENVGHNVSIYSDAGYQTRLFEGVVFSGPATRWYPVPALGAGTWVFKCDLHPEMTGRLHAS
ncbi:MAG: hypothetical protein ABIZ52_05885 [Candidatus Limnocylindrales bacterium]